MAVRTGETTAASTRLRYYLPVATVAAAAVVSFAALPSYLGGVVGFISVSTMSLIHRVSLKPVDTTPRRLRVTLYSALSAVVLAGSLVLAVTVARNLGALWVAWVMASLVFVVFSGTAWVGEATRRESPWSK